nr:aldehyde dehydrogenase family protein [Candidatus Woesearchaeota archaeon]
MRLYKLFIDGKWVSSSSRKTFVSKNPANLKPLGKFYLANKTDVDKAVIAAKKSLALWSETPAPKRGEILLKIAQLLKRDKEKLAKIMTQEMGKVLNESRGDVQEAIDVFEYMAGEGRRLFGNTTPSELKNKFCMTIRIPIGIVGIITPWNFPIAIPSWKLSAALICGNTCILKPSSDAPLCAVELIKILNEAGMPKGVVNLVTGSGNEAGTAIIKHKDIRAISFTGNVETGKFILKNAGIKKVGLELGGKNPIIVMDDADLDLAVDGIIWGGFGTTGQRCTAASRVIVHKKVKNKLERLLLKRIKRLRIGDGLNKKTDIGPLVNEKAVEKTEKYVNIGKKEGAKLLYGGEKTKMKGCFYKPTLFTNVKRNMRIAKEEIFGPFVSIIPVKNLNEAIEVANDVNYGLSSAIYTENISNAFKAIEKIEAGLTYVNSSTIGSEVHLPFGGVKETGNGTREGGIVSIDEFSEIKTVYFDYSNKLQKSQGIK